MFKFQICRGESCVACLFLVFEPNICEGSLRSSPVLFRCVFVLHLDMVPFKHLPNFKVHLFFLCLHYMSLLQPMQRGATLTVHPCLCQMHKVSPKNGMLPKSVPMPLSDVDLFSKRTKNL